MVMRPDFVFIQRLLFLQMAKCPVLAKEYNIITIANMDSLQLSSYDRQPGTTVRVSCLSNTFKVSGASSLTCLTNGSWDKPIPRCINRREFSQAQPNTSAMPTPVRKGQGSYLHVLYKNAQRKWCIFYTSYSQNQFANRNPVWKKDISVIPWTKSTVLNKLKHLQWE